MGQLIIYGFTQLRRHPLITFFSTTLPLSIAVFVFLFDIFYLQQSGPEFDPVDQSAANRHSPTERRHDLDAGPSYTHGHSDRS